MSAPRMGEQRLPDAQATHAGDPASAPAGKVPFHKLDADTQRQLMRMEKAAVTAQQIERWLDAWNEASCTLGSVGMDRRAVGLVVGMPGAFDYTHHEGLRALVLTGLALRAATPQETLDVYDAIRGGALQIVTRRRWCSNDRGIERTCEVLHAARGRFEPFVFDFGRFFRDKTGARG